MEKHKQESKVDISEEEKAKAQQAESDSLLAALKYRDRAKERRIKYGTPEPPSPTFGSSSATKRPKNRDADDEDAISPVSSTQPLLNSFSSSDSMSKSFLNKNKCLKTKILFSNQREYRVCGE